MYKIRSWHPIKAHRIQVTKSSSLLVFLKLPGQSWEGEKRLYPTYLKQSDTFFFTAFLM